MTVGMGVAPAHGAVAHHSASSQTGRVRHAQTATSKARLHVPSDVRSNQRVTVGVVVTARRKMPRGHIVVREGTRTLGSASVPARRHPAARMMLPRLEPGRHVLWGALVSHAGKVRARTRSAVLVSHKPPTHTPAPDPAPAPAPAPDPAPSTGCVAQPSACGLPDASTTGPAAGTAFKTVGPGGVTSGPGWHYDSRGWVTVDGKGAVFEGYRVPFNVDITASDVTVRNNLLEYSSNEWGFSLRHTTNVTIDHNTIHGGSTPTTVCDNAIRDIYGDSDAVTITNNNIYGCASGINHFDRGGLIQGNYIHDIGFTCPAGSGTDCGHFNGIQLGSGSGPLMTIDKNTILIPAAYTDAVMLANDDGAQTNRRITNNLLAGGAYTFYGSGGASGQATNIVFTGNRFSTKYFANSGSYGPVAHWQNSTGNVWSNNTWDDGPRAGTSVTP